MLQGYLNYIRYSRPFQSLEHLKPILVHLSCWDTISDNWISCYVQKSGADNTQLHVSTSKKRFSVMQMSNWLKKKREMHKTKRPAYLHKERFPWIKKSETLFLKWKKNPNISRVFCATLGGRLQSQGHVRFISGPRQVKIVGRNVFCHHWLAGTHCLFQLDQALVINVF